MHIEEEPVIKWISGKRHNQRRALAHALTKPMTTSEIFSSMKQQGSRARLSDVATLLRHFMQQGLIYQITRRSVTGNVFFWTEYGKTTARSLNIMFVKIAADFDWNAYADVVSGILRRNIIIFMNTLPAHKDIMSAEQIRKALSAEKSVGLRSVTRSLRILLQKKLLECVNSTGSKAYRFYRLTEKGIQIASQLVKSPI